MLGLRQSKWDSEKQGGYPKATEWGKSKAGGGRSVLCVESYDLCSFTVFPFTGLQENKATFNKVAGIHISRPAT